MHLSTAFISFALALAGMSAAVPVEREHMLVARLLTDVEARAAYDEGPELYVRGNAQSGRPSFGRKKKPAQQPSGSSGSTEQLIQAPPPPPPKKPTLSESVQQTGFDTTPKPAANSPSSSGGGGQKNDQDKMLKSLAYTGFDVSGGRRRRRRRRSFYDLD